MDIEKIISSLLNIREQVEQSQQRLDTILQTFKDLKNNFENFRNNFNEDLSNLESQLYALQEGEKYAATMQEEKKLKEHWNNFNVNCELQDEEQVARSIPDAEIIKSELNIPRDDTHRDRGYHQAVYVGIFVDITQVSRGLWIFDPGIHTRYLSPTITFSQTRIGWIRVKGQNSYLKPRERHIWRNLPAKTAMMRDLQGLKASAFTRCLKEMRWRATCRWRLMRRQQLLLLTVRKNMPYGETTRRQMSEEDWTEDNLLLAVQVDCSIFNPIMAIHFVRNIAPDFADNELENEFFYIRCAFSVNCKSFMEKFPEVAETQKAMEVSDILRRWEPMKTTPYMDKQRMDLSWGLPATQKDFIVASSLGTPSSTESHITIPTVPKTSQAPVCSVSQWNPDFVSHLIVAWDEDNSPIVGLSARLRRVGLQPKKFTYSCVTKTCGQCLSVGESGTMQSVYIGNTFSRIYAAVGWKLDMTIIFPESHLLQRLFTPSLVRRYEEFYQEYGVKFLKGVSIKNLEAGFDGRVAAFKLGKKSFAPLVLDILLLRGFLSDGGGEIYMGLQVLEDAKIVHQLLDFLPLNVVFKHFDRGRKKYSFDLALQERTSSMNYEGLTEDRELQELLIHVEPIDNVHDMKKRGGPDLDLQELHHSEPYIRELVAGILRKANHMNVVNVSSTEAVSLLGDVRPQMTQACELVELPLRHPQLVKSVCEKLDVVAYGREIMGFKVCTGYGSLSGTSVASPHVSILLGPFLIICLYWLADWKELMREADYGRARYVEDEHNVDQQIREKGNMEKLCINSQLKKKKFVSSTKKMLKHNCTLWTRCFEGGGFVTRQLLQQWKTQAILGLDWVIRVSSGPGPWVKCWLVDIYFNYKLMLMIGLEPIS